MSEETDCWFCCPPPAQDEYDCHEQQRNVDGRKPRRRHRSSPRERFYSFPTGIFQYHLSPDSEQCSNRCGLPGLQCCGDPLIVGPYLVGVPPPELVGLYTYQEWMEFAETINQARYNRECPHLPWAFLLCLCVPVIVASNVCRQSAECDIMETENKRLAPFGLQWIYKYRVLVWTPERVEYERQNPLARKVTQERTPWPSNQQIIAERQSEHAQRKSHMAQATGPQTVNVQSRHTPAVMPMAVAAEPLQHNYLSPQPPRYETMAEPGTGATNSGVEGATATGTIITPNHVNLSECDGEKKFCRGCGKLSKDPDDAFCGKCGKQL